MVQHPEQILFRCSSSTSPISSSSSSSSSVPSSSSFGQCISCHEGHVFEINNQTYHTVSNCDTDYRVHLILDYIDDAYLHTPTTTTTTTTTHPPQHHSSFLQLPLLSPQRYTLQKGETMYQTRRSLDRFLHYGQRKTPTFMILGSQKAGTTYLFECIMSHPLAIKPKNNRRETHSLDWNYKHYESTRQQQQYIQSFYYYKELQYHPSCFTGDSTPSYLMDHVRVLPRMQRLYHDHHPNIKFIVLCRHPIHRAISHYAMVTSTKPATPAQMKSRGSEWRQTSFAQVVIHDLIHMKQCGLIPYWSIPGLTIHTNINDTAAIQFILQSLDTAIWNDTKFQSFTGSVAEETAWTNYITTHVPLHTGSYGLVSRGLYHIQIRMWRKVYPDCHFLCYKFESMTSSSNSTTTTTCPDLRMKWMQQIWDHLQVPYYEIPSDVLEQKQNSRDYIKSDILDPTSKLYHFLQRFYHPHNQQLHTVLRKMQHDPNESVAHQATYDSELFEHHWGASSIQWTE